MFINIFSKQSNIFLLIGIFLIFNSCKDKNNTTEPSSEKQIIAKEIVPLKLGNTWTYKITTYNQDGTVAWIDTLIEVIRSDTIVNGEVWKLVSPWTVWSYRNDSIGFHETNWEHIYYTYPYPAHIGDISDYWSVISIDTVVNTPIGNLHCYKYKIQWFGFPFYTLIAPGVGIVQSENARGGDSTITSLSELIGVQLN